MSRTLLWDQRWHSEAVPPHGTKRNSANFSSIATDAKGVIQIFNVGVDPITRAVVGTITVDDA